MIKVKCNQLLIFCLAMTNFALVASAQMFLPETASSSSSSSVKSEQVKAEGAGWNKFYNNGKKDNSSSENSQSQTKSEPQQQKTQSKQAVTNPQDYIYKDVPQVDRPTLDGVKRGRTSVINIVPNSKVKSEGFIYLYYSDFSVRKMMSGSMSCDVKFEIVTTLDRRLNSLAIRLVWPNMQTPLTFLDVNPNQKYQMPYTLLGEGCYSMDKIPNIVVNRCRVKGMSQEECANRVRWMRKM